MNIGYIAKIEVDSTELNMILTSLRATRIIHKDKLEKLNNNLEKLDELIETLEEVKYMKEDELLDSDYDF